MCFFIEEIALREPGSIGIPYHLKFPTNHAHLKTFQSEKTLLLHIDSAADIRCLIEPLDVNKK